MEDPVFYPSGWYIQVDLLSYESKYAYCNGFYRTNMAVCHRHENSKNFTHAPGWCFRLPNLEELAYIYTHLVEEPHEKP